MFALKSCREKFVRRAEKDGYDHGEIEWAFMYVAAGSRRRPFPFVDFQGRSATWNDRETTRRKSEAGENIAGIFGNRTTQFPEWMGESVRAADQRSMERLATT